ncbi:MAG: proprotein convertase P-domain-containing protein [Phycisphaeraceae bacterium]
MLTRRAWQPGTRPGRRGRYVRPLRFVAALAAVAATLSVLSAHGRADVVDLTFTAGPNLNLVIPDGAFDLSIGSAVGSSIVVEPGGPTTIQDIEVEVAIDHALVGDVVMFLIHTPDVGPSTRVNLVARPGYPFGLDQEELGERGGSLAELQSGVPIRFDDDAATSSAQMDGGGGSPNVVGLNGSPAVYRPSWDMSAPALSDFNGTDLSGTWTLYVADASPGYAGTLEQWSLIVTTVPEPGSLALVLGMGGWALLRRRGPVRG